MSDDVKKLHDKLRMAYASINWGMTLLVEVGTDLEKLMTEKGVEPSAPLPGPGPAAIKVDPPKVFTGTKPVPAPQMLPAPLDVASREQLIARCHELGYTEVDTRAKKVKDLKDMIAKGEQAPPQVAEVKPKPALVVKPATPGTKLILKPRT